MYTCMHEFPTNACCMKCKGTSAFALEFTGIVILTIIIMVYSFTNRYQCILIYVVFHSDIKLCYQITSYRRRACVHAWKKLFVLSYEPLK